MFYYPCPCGDKFQISVDELLDGEGVSLCDMFGSMIFGRVAAACCTHVRLGVQTVCAVQETGLPKSYPSEQAHHWNLTTFFCVPDIAHCPSCSLLLRVIYDEEALNKLAEAG